MILLDDFEQYLQYEKQASANTIVSYMRDLRQFSAYAEQHLQCELHELDRDAVNAYLSFLLAGGKSGATAARSLSAIRCFYAYCVLKGLIEQSPVYCIQIARTEKKLPQVLTGKEIELFLHQPDETERKGQRDKAMLELMYGTGMRVSELIALDISDIDLPARQVRCSHGAKSRLIPISPSAVSALRTYLSLARPSMQSQDDEQALFLNVNGERITRQGFWKIVKHYQQTAQIKKEITPYVLRHSLAAHLLEKGADIQSVQKMLGHHDISSTQIYAQVVAQRSKSSYRRYSSKV